VRTPIRAITARPSLPPASHTPSPTGPPLRVTFHLLVETMGLTTFRTSTTPGGVRLCLSAGGAASAGGVMAPPPPGHVPFGSSLSAPLACCPLRRLNGSSPELAIPSNPSSRPPREAGSRSVPSRFGCRLNRAEATLSRELRTPGLPPTHVPVRSRWQNTGSSLINTRAPSCRPPLSDVLCGDFCHGKLTLEHAGGRLPYLRSLAPSSC